MIVPNDCMVHSQLLNAILEEIVGDFVLFQISKENFHFWTINKTLQNHVL